MVNFRSCCLKLRTFTALFAFVTVIFFTSLNLQASATTKKLSPEDRMSSTGRLAASVRKQLRKAGAAGEFVNAAMKLAVQIADAQQVPRRLRDRLVILIFRELP